MSRIDLVALAQQRVAEVIAEGDIVIDATLGNGHDTLFLAQRIGERGHLYGFDIQPAALAATQQRLAQHHLLARATLLPTGHETMAAQIPAHHHSRIKAVMFNLGYLPGNDHTLRTHSTTTLQALETARALLVPDGLIVIVAYTGHNHGRAETEAVKAWARGLEGKGFAVEITVPPSRQGNAPELVVMRRGGSPRK
ncbi:MAG TPA: class I SAM-dependent methyltransferase [Gammaproteobacteria bacterium]